MKKLFALIAIAMVSSTTLFATATKNKPVKSKKKIHIEVVCWISEIYTAPNGVVTTWYRCKEVCTDCGYAQVSQNSKGNILS